MKISKLFHWLYAILMLLPFAFFVPSVLYYAFNDNATMQSVEVPKTETIAVDFNQKAKYLEDGTYNGVTYVVNNATISFNGTMNNVPLYGQTNLAGGIVFHRDNSKYLVKIDTDFTNGKFGITGYGSYSPGVTEFIWSTQDSSDWRGGIFLYTNQIYTFNNYFVIQVFDLTQMFGRGNEPTIAQFNEWFTNSFYPYTESELMQITYETGTTEQLIENTSIINYAWESIWDLPLFNWCKVSFVATPFTFITGLFGLAASNSFNYVFTYFASMSIIWLVFDVIMYVPLLVHRWLDKGIVE